MCGRFCCSLNPESIKTKLYKDNISKNKDIEWQNEDKYHSSYNVCPTRYIVAMYQEAGKKKQVLDSMRWGYVPSWSRNTSMAKPINARLETLLEKSMFDLSKNTKRCVIIAEGFYEWKKLQNNKKQPHFIKRKDGQLVVFAGLYDTNTFIADNLTSCAIITTHSSKFFSAIHDRMPVILDSDNIDIWLNNAIEWSQPVIDLLKPYEGPLDCYQVTDAVGPVKNDSPEFIVPVDSKKSSISFYAKKEDSSSKFEKFKKEEEFKATTTEPNSPTTSSPSSSSTTNNKKRKSSVVDEFKNSKKKSTAPSKDNAKITNFFVKK